MFNFPLPTLCEASHNVGKTTTTVNLGVGLAKTGQRVLLVDADPQGSLTISLGIKDPDSLNESLATVMSASIEDIQLATETGIIHHKEGVDLMPSNIELSGMETGLFNTMSREFVLRNYINTVKHNYDYILIDCMSKNLKYCKTYADRFAECGCESLLLSGPIGLGTTYLSACIARHISDAGFNVVYVTAQKIFRDYELEKFGISQPENQNLSTKYKICDLLIIDDFGTEMVTQFTISALYDIVNQRLVDNRATIISTNVVPEMIASKYSPQISSRSCGMYHMIKFIGRDIRLL